MSKWYDKWLDEVNRREEHTFPPLNGAYEVSWDSKKFLKDT